MAEEAKVQPVNIFDSSMRNIRQAMLVAARKQAVIAHNIANANVPGFKPLTFDEELNKAVQKIGASAVVIEEEMAALAKNAARYSAYSRLMTSKIAALRSVVTQGRR